jgi:hypothetical protein
MEVESNGEESADPALVFTAGFSSSETWKDIKLSDLK